MKGAKINFSFLLVFFSMFHAYSFRVILCSHAVSSFIRFYYTYTSDLIVYLKVIIGRDAEPFR